MTENRIFEILLKNNSGVNLNCDYPKLQTEAVEIIAEKFADILYETNQKSPTSQSLRGKVLQYLHTTCGVRQAHVADDSYECFLKILKPSLRCNVTGDISKLISAVNLELEKDVPTTLSDKMVDFYKRKNSKQKEKISKLEYIGKMNQKKLDLKFDMQVRKNFSYYEISENMIKDLVGSSGTKSKENKSEIIDINQKEYREKQIKFCYAILNLKSDLQFLDIILQRLADYERLESFEVHFLLHLWTIEDESLDFSSFVMEKFPVVLERVILKHSTEILHLKEDKEVNQYFSNLEKDKKIIKLKKFCQDNVLLNRTLKSLVYELYCYSFCNKNVLRLMDLIQ